jgi:ADP-heptose:LPS heptosyltransferase
VLANLTREHEVVLLNTPDRYDEHEDFTAAARGRLHSVEHLMTPERNLDVQTRIIGGADAFVGTYGGFSYLAPFLGVDTVAFYSQPNGFRFDHMEVSKRVFSSLKGGTFSPILTRELDALRLTLGADAPVVAGR